MSTAFLMSPTYDPKRYGENYRGKQSRESQLMRERWSDSKAAHHAAAAAGVMVAADDDLSAEQAEKLADAFALFDTQHNELISSRFIGMALRSIGLVPTQRELDRELTEIGARDVSLQEVMDIAKKYLYKRADDEDLFAAFSQVFDKEGTGYVDPAEVQEAAANVDNPMSAAEVQQLIQDFVKVPGTNAAYQDINTLSTKNRYRPQRMALMRGLDFTHYMSSAAASSRGY